MWMTVAYYALRWVDWGRLQDLVIYFVRFVVFPVYISLRYLFIRSISYDVFSSRSHILVVVSS